MTHLQTLKNPLVAKLTFIQFISYFGAWFSQVAIASMILEFRANDIVISLVFVMSFLPAMILAPINGMIVDRIGFKKLMGIALLVEMSMTLLFTTINSLDLVWLLMIFIFIRTTCATIIFTAEMSFLPKILEGKMLQNTNEIHSAIWSISFALGMAFGGLSTHYFGYDVTFLIDVSLYTIALVIFFTLKINLDEKPNYQSSLSMIKEAFAYIRGNKKIFHLMMVHAVIGLTVFDVIVALLAKIYYADTISEPLAIGWLNAIRAIGLVIGMMIFNRYVDKKNLHLFLFAEAIFISFWALLQNDFYLSILGMFTVGLLVTNLWAYTYTMLQEEIEANYLGRILAYNDMLFMGIAVTTTLLIGYASDKGIKLENITLTIAFGFVISGFYYIWFKRKYL
jgi:MFS family permease